MTASTISPTDDDQALGRESYHAGLLPTDNPFTEGSPKNIAWVRGYDVAKAAGPPVPTAGAVVLRRDAVFNRAINELVIVSATSMRCANTVIAAIVLWTSTSCTRTCSNSSRR
jgi:hypothetical protein